VSGRRSRCAALWLWSAQKGRVRHCVEGHTGHRRRDESGRRTPSRRRERCRRLYRSHAGSAEPPKREPGAGFLNRYVNTPIARLVLGQHFVDVALMEDLLRDSGLDWTAVRPPRLTNGPLSGTYRTAYGRNVRGGFLISRADVAHLMLRVLEQPETIKQAISVAN
jgi:hypothetical protein